MGRQACRLYGWKAQRSRSYDVLEQEEENAPSGVAPPIRTGHNDLQSNAFRWTTLGSLNPKGKP